MKRFIFVILFLSCSLLASAQDYLKEAKDCFEKGDYECAKKNYNLFKIFDGSKDISVQIQKSDECLKVLLTADKYFKDKEYGKAKDCYKTILDKNPKDAYVKKQYEQCLSQLNSHKLSNQASQVSSSNNHIANYTEKSANLNLEMVAVQGGTFTMGCTPEQGDDCDKEKKTVHQVTLSSFYIGKYEVTQGQWKTVMGNNPSNFKGDSLPVEQVNWNDVQKFIRKLNVQSSKQYRLPTEAEWEYACRGGLQSVHYKYSGSNNPSVVAWYNNNSGGITHPVGRKSSNELGVFDMSGNVYEWCSDWYGDYSNNAQTNPKGPSSGSYRVGRGGSWGSEVGSVRVSYRYIISPNTCYHNLGFRLACSSE